MSIAKKYSLVFIFAYIFLFFLGVKALFHGLPDIERFFAEWMDERITLTSIIKFGTLNFAPTIIMHPPLYHYLTFIPIGIFFLIGKLIGFFHDKVDFVGFYFNSTHYFFLIGRAMSYIFYWLSAVMIFKTARLFYSKLVSHITAISFLLIPRFIFDFSTTRPETLLFLTTSIFFYFFFRYYLNKEKVKYLYLSALFLGVSAATKYNALLLGVIFLVGLKDYKRFFVSYIRIGFFILLGFFICNPFFILQFSKYFYNLMMYNKEAKYYWIGHYPAVFFISHVKELSSFIYLNIFGFLILLFGGWHLFKKDRKLSMVIFFTALAYEVYFGIFQRSISPLRYLNPILPIAAFIFSAGIDFIVTYKRKFTAVLIVFFAILFYNYFDIWQGFCSGPTYLQRARAFIEKDIPGFTTICIAANDYIPQLNMTRESYYRLIETAPGLGNIPGHELTYKDMDNEERYDNVFRELRIKSLTKDPQYNLVRWDNGIETEKDVRGFLERSNVEYIISKSALKIENKNLEDTKIASLVKIFRPQNKRVYETVYGDASLFLYKINRGY